MIREGMVEQKYRSHLIGILKKGAKLVEISFLFTKFFELDQNSRKQKRVKGESMKKNGFCSVVKSPS